MSVKLECDRSDINIIVAAAVDSPAVPLTTAKLCILLASAYSADAISSTEKGMQHVCACHRSEHRDTDQQQATGDVSSHLCLAILLCSIPWLMGVLSVCIDSSVGQCNISCMCAGACAAAVTCAACMLAAAAVRVMSQHALLTAVNRHHFLLHHPYKPAVVVLVALTQLNMLQAL